MSRVIVLEECYDCPHYTEALLLCYKANKPVPDETKIPHWCPLPNEEDV